MTWNLPADCSASCSDRFSDDEGLAFLQFNCTTSGVKSVEAVVESESFSASVRFDRPAWHRASDGIDTDASVSEVFIDPTVPDGVYALAKRGDGTALYRSTDAASSWLRTHVGTTVEGDPLEKIIVTPQGDLFAIQGYYSGGNENKIVVSYDHGTTWSSAGLSGRLSAITLDGAGHLYALDQGQNTLHVSGDWGTTWELKSFSIVGVYSLFGGIDATVYFTSGDDRLWVSTDGGTSSHGISPGHASPVNTVMGIHAVSTTGTLGRVIATEWACEMMPTPMTCIATSYAEAWLSDDWGEHWRSLVNPFLGNIDAIASRASSPDVYWISLAPQTWYGDPLPLTGPVWRLDAVSGVLTDASEGLRGSDTTSLAAHPTRDGLIYAVVGSTVFVTETDGL